MTSRDFCYWLQGFFEITQAGMAFGDIELHEDQVKCIQNHLKMVFIHEIDPSFPAEQQDALTEAHENLDIESVSSDRGRYLMKC